MKVGVVGAGGVGAACLMALVLRASAREIVVVDRTAKRAKAVATDLRYGVPLGPRIDVIEGDYEDLANADVVLVTAGVNEQAGGATDRSDPEGRLKLLDKNADIYRDMIPKIVKVAPEAVLVAVTDPPDPLADLTRQIAGHDAVLSTGTWLDSLRFRTHIARKLDVSPDTVEAQILGEAWYIGSFCLVRRPRSRRPAYRPVAQTRRQPGGLPQKRGRRSALRQHRYYRRQRGEPIWDRHRLCPHCRVHHAR